MSKLKKSVTPAAMPLRTKSVFEPLRNAPRSSARTRISHSSRSLSTVVTAPRSITAAASGMESKMAMPTYQSAGTANEPRITGRARAMSTLRPKSWKSQASSWPSSRRPWRTKTSRYGTLPRR